MRIAILLLSAWAALGADDPWAKVEQLRSGAELRVFRKAKPPLLAQMGELTAEHLVVIVNKKEQTAIAREEIDRIDARPMGKSRVTRETRTVTDAAPKAEPPPAGPGAARGGPTMSQSSGLSIGSKPDFETVYRRTASAAK